MMFSRFAAKPNLWLLSVCLLFSALLLGQTDRGEITGTVKDATGAVIPGAKVTVVNTATNSTLELSTNETGEYTAPNLAVGNYVVRADKPGFTPAQTNNVTVNAATTARVDVTLQIGQSQQVVEVQANAILMNTEDARSSVTINSTLVNTLPLEVAGAVRSPFDLATLTPEAKNVGGDYGFAIGGGQAAAYQATLDGVSVDTSRALQKSWVSSNSPSVEAITQFTVDTNGYKAEYAHLSGGTMTFVSKSGTNEYHGDAYEFLRNNDFDANDWFSNRAGRARQIYKQNDFGFTFGGPIIIPKIYNGKNKTFFFFSLEGFRNRNGATNATATVPTAEMYNGDFSKWVTSSGSLIPIYDPQTLSGTGANATATPFPGNQIPKSRFSPAAVKALGVFQQSGVLTTNNGALPGTASYVNNNYIIANGTNVQPIDKRSIKGDEVISEKMRVSGYYGYDRESTVPGPDGPPTLPGYYSNYNDLHQNSDVIRASFDWALSPTKLNHFYAGWNDWRQNHNPPQEYIGNWQSKFCLPNVPDCNQNLVNLFSGGTSDPYTTWGGQANNGSENPAWGYNDDFTWIKGAHTIKFGGELQINHYNGFGRQCISGCVGFSYLQTGKPGVQDPNQGGNAFASFLLGLADTGQIDTVRFIGQRFPYIGGFIQDDWHVNKKLVVNVGLRYDVNLPPCGQNGEWSDFSPTTPNPGAGGRLGAVIFAGTGPGRQGSCNLADSWYGGFGPRLGLAYALGSKTTIRASYGIAYGQLMAVTGSAHNMGFTLTQVFGSQNTSLVPSFTLDQGMPPWTAPPFVNPSVSNGSTVSWWQGKEATRLPETNNINFSIQRQLTPSLILEGSYNGVLGEHLQADLLDYNQVNPSYLTAFGSIAQSTAVLNSQVGSALANQYGITAPYPGFTGTVKQALRPYPQYTTIQTFEGAGDHSGHSTYHAAIIRLEKRYSRGLTLQTSYVFSKLLTDADSYWGNASNGGTGPYLAADQYNRKLEKSIGEYDQTHNFKAGFVYDLPFGKGRQWLTHGPASWIIGDWGINGILTYGSGLPVEITSSYVLPLYATENGRPIPYITSYNGWQPNWGGSFNPTTDNFFVPYCTAGQANCTGPFPYQGSGTNLNGFGNSTRFNPKVRQFPYLNENLSVARVFPIRERFKIEFRAEAFNVLNRVQFGTGSTQLQNQNFGHLTSSADLLNTPRQLQLALKFYF